MITARVTLRGVIGRRGAAAVVLLAACLAGPRWAYGTPASTVAVVGPWQTTAHTVAGGRTFRLHAPTVAQAPEPLVVALHGYSQSSAVWEPTTGLTPFSEGRFALAYGEGVGASWNAGPDAPSPQACCGTARDQHVDDVAYVAAVIAAAEALTPVDPARVYLIGGSNGGMMALKAGCNLPQVTAVVVVAGALLVPCPNGVDTLHIHGTSDTTVPLAGPGFQGTVFLPAVTEATRMPRGAVWAMLPFHGGHTWPGWVPPQADAFWAHLNG